MSKKDFLKTMDYASYFSIILASVLVLMFEFAGVLMLFKLSLVLYGAAFLILCVLCITKLVFMKKEIKENDVLLVDKTKESKTWIVVRLVLSAILFGLMIAYLCMF